MRRAAEEVRHAAALVVNQDESDLVGVIVQHQRQHKRLDELTFSGARRARDKAVRPVLLFMDVEIHRLAAVAHADLRADGLIRPVRFPLPQQIPVCDIRQMVHLQKFYLPGNFAVGELVDPVAAESARHLLRKLRRQMIKGDNVRFTPVFIHPERTAEALVGLNEEVTLVGQQLQALIGKQKLHMILRAACQIAVDRVVIQNVGVCTHDHIVWKRALGVGFFLLSCAQHVEKV